MAETSNIQWTDSTFNPIDGFSAYRVSPDGAVYSCWSRGGKRRLTSNWRPLPTDKGAKGHLRVTLYDGMGGKRRVLLHRLILEVFVGPCPDGCEGCHNDGNPENNALANLRWDTAQSNWADRKAHGRWCEGEKNPSAKLTLEQVNGIRQDCTPGVNKSAIARKYGVTPQMVHLILTGQKWSQSHGN